MKDKIKVIHFSDVHLEFWSEHLLEEGFQIMGYRREDLETCDLIIIAGDLNNISFSETHTNIHIFKSYQHSEKFLEEVLAYNKPVILVAGNHEYYHSDYYEVQKYYKKLKNEKIKQGKTLFKNFYYLEKDYVDLEDLKIRIYGATLWSGELKINKNKDFVLREEMTFSDKMAQGYINDYKKVLISDEDLLPLEKQRYLNAIPIKTENNLEINFKYKKLDFNFTKQEFFKSLNNLKEASKTLPNDYELWVVTHHLPSINGIEIENKKDFLKNDLNIFYYSKLELFLIKNKINPKHWFHGHWHYSPKEYNFKQINLYNYFTKEEIEKNNYSQLETKIHTNIFGYIKYKVKNNKIKTKKEKTNFLAELNLL